MFTKKFKTKINDMKSKSTEFNLSVEKPKIINREYERSLSLGSGIGFTHNKLFEIKTIQEIWEYLHQEIINENIKHLKLSKKDEIKYVLLKRMPFLSESYVKSWNMILKNEIRQSEIVDYFRNNEKIIIHQGDLVQIKADALIYQTSNLVGCTEWDCKCMSSYIHSKAGPELKQECIEILKNRIQSSIITHGHNLLVKYIIHLFFQNKTDIKQIELYYNSSLDNLQNLCVKSVVISPFHVYDDLCLENKFDCYDIMFETVRKWITKNKSNIKIIFCVNNEEEFQLMNELMKKHKK
jgi:O-acetyl-ADP-ribose deacetylase (regulator of RNase III)